MSAGSNFVLIVMALALAVFPLFGGSGLVVLAVAAYFWQLAPYRRGIHSAMSEVHHKLLLPQQDALQTLSGPRRPKLYFLQLLLCAGLLFLGLMRLENRGVLGSALFG